MRKLCLTLLPMLLAGCVHQGYQVYPISLTNFESGEVLQGQYSRQDNSVSVTMPNGETLSGRYTALSNTRVTSDTFNPMYSVTTRGGRSNAYALLKSKTSKLLMEIIVSYSESSGHGFGEAKTNDGRTFKVQF
jgi:hypothetical protein